MKQYKNKVSVAVVGLVFFFLSLASWILPSKNFSDSERRKLAMLPKLSLTAILDGSYMTDFESFTLDQFPMRDTLRSVKAFTTYYALGQLDNHGIYVKDGYAAKLEYPLDKASVTHAVDCFTRIYDQYLAGKNTKLYASVIPDKGYFLAEKNGYPCMDYEMLFQILKDDMSYAEYIDITDTLEITDYYKTDTHWRQEKLIETAEALAARMGTSLTGSYTVNTLDTPFYGVYYGQSALPLRSETIDYLTNDILDGCIVTNHEKGTTGGLYDMEKGASKDPYEMFLSGPVSLITIDNPNCSSDKELIIFRDSFGSSIAPLLAEGYEKITLVDIRYLRSDFLGRFIEFDDQDVLFLYSTLVLNNSETLN